MSSIVEQLFNIQNVHIRPVVFKLFCMEVWTYVLWEKLCCMFGAITHQSYLTYNSNLDNIYGVSLIVEQSFDR